MSEFVYNLTARPLLQVSPLWSQRWTRTKDGQEPSGGPWRNLRERGETDQLESCRPVRRLAANQRRRTERKSKRNAQVLLFPKILVPGFHMEPQSSGGLLSGNGGLRSEVGPSVIRRQRAASGKTRRPSLDMEPAGGGRGACACAAGDAAAAAGDGRTRRGRITPWTDPRLQPGRHERGRKRE